MITTTNIGRMMMSVAAQLDDDREFNRWAKLAPKLIGMGSNLDSKSIKSLSTEEQQVLFRAIATIGIEKIRAA